VDKLEIMKEFDKGQIRRFLMKVNYKNFNLFPNITQDKLANYLLSDLNKIFKVGKIFLLLLNNEVIAVVAIKDSNWDTHHFGYKCASIDYVLISNEVDTNLLSKPMEKLFCKIGDYANSEKIKFISVDIGADENIISSVLQNHNFKYILTWLDGVFQSKDKIPVIYEDHEVGIMKESELDYFQKIASTCYFKGGRFFLDSNFESCAVNQMYAKLIMSSYQNDDIMLAYRIKGESVGLFICRKILKFYKYFDMLKVSSNRFFVIDTKYRQNNIGYDLFARTLNHLMDYSDIITTGFEVHNIPSLNLHKKFNFKFNYAHNVYHWWAK